MSLKKYIEKLGRLLCVREFNGLKALHFVCSLLNYFQIDRSADSKSVFSRRVTTFQSISRHEKARLYAINCDFLLLAYAIGQHMKRTVRANALLHVRFLMAIFISFWSMQVINVHSSVGLAK